MLGLIMLNPFYSFFVQYTEQNNIKVVQRTEQNDTKIVQYIEQKCIKIVQ